MTNPKLPVYPSLTSQRLLWLVRLRWYALAGVSLATLLAAAGLNPGVNLPVLIGAIAIGLLFNIYFWHRVQVSPMTRRDAMTQVFVDIGAMTVVLWAGGGAEVPFASFYFFHIIIGGILVGPKAAATSAIAALAAMGFLETSELIPILKISTWELPSPLWDHALSLLSFVLTVSFIAYFVTHIMDELQERHLAVIAERERAGSALARLTFTLDHIDAGMEVLDQEGRRTWHNQTFQRLFPQAISGDTWRCPGTQEHCPGGQCPVFETASSGLPHRCRIHLHTDTQKGEEPEPQTYELISYPLSTEHSTAQVMNLYMNRTRELSLQNRVDQAERLAGFGRLAQGLAHELNTPLGTIHALVTDIKESVLTPLRTRLERDGDPRNAEDVGDALESCDVIQDASRRCRHITTSLLSGRGLYGEETRGNADLQHLVDHACVLVFGTDGPRPEVHTTLPKGLSLETDADRLNQVLVNLLRNARDAAGSQGAIDIEAREDGDGIRLMISDNGPGIPSEVSPRLFEPFFTTKEPGEGTGLGLYTSYVIVQRLGGQIEVNNLRGGGARATLWLPRAPRNADLPQKPEGAGPAPFDLN